MRLIVIDHSHACDYGSAMDTINDLIGDIESYLARTGMTETQFGLAAINDGSLISRRLRGGMNVKISTIDKVRRFMADNPPEAADG